MNALTDNGFLPEEPFSKKSSTTEDEKFDKTLIEDLSRQARYPMAAVSVETVQCYDRVNHMIVDPVTYALIGMQGPIAVSLTCLQTMKFFQRTCFSDSTIFLDGGQL